MVNFVKRERGDIFNRPILGFLFKNRHFLLMLRTAVTALFFYAVYYGFTHTGKENLFTAAVFWGIFWALFMVATLPTFGRIFCGICPHGFLGKYVSRFGLKKEMPGWLKNRYIGIVLLVIGWWGVYYTFPGFWRTPLGTASMFGGVTLLAFILYYLYKDMSYCKFICPIGTLTRAYGKLSFTKLETYTDSCKECKTFECATACPYNQKPFTFAKKNQMDDCSLCMECAHACEAVKFSFTRPGETLYGKFKGLNAEIWSYILILGSIPISMAFAHGLDRSNIADQMIWNQTAAVFGLSRYAGGFGFLYALIFTVFFAVVGLWLASLVLKKEYHSTFANLGYAYAPLFILGSLAHALESFFTRGYEKIVAGFAQGFGFVVEVAPLAKRGESWLIYFGILKWLAVIWALLILYKRLKLVESTKLRKSAAYIFASMLIIFFVSVNMYRGYVLKTYGQKEGAHGGESHRMHGGGETFQSVPFDQAMQLQKRKDQSVSKNDTIYFSLTDPAAKKSGMSGMSHGGGRPGAVPTKKVWLLYGEGLENPHVLIESDGKFSGVDWNKRPIRVKKSRGEYPFYRFELSRNGYYNLYFTKELEAGKTLYLKTAKLEYLKGSHGGEDIYDPKKMTPFISENHVDLIRLRDEDEDSFFHRFYTGELLRFKVLVNKKPAAGAEVAVHVGSGWVKKVTTNEKGIASFHIIKEYFPDEWSEFDKRHESRILVVGKISEASKEGPYARKVYEISYPLSFYPSASEYRSYAYSLIFITLTLLLASYVVYRYRRNRTRPFQEIKHEE